MVVHIGLEIATSASFQPIPASDSFAIEERVGKPRTRWSLQIKTIKFVVWFSLSFTCVFFRTAVDNTIGREPETLQ